MYFLADWYEVITDLDISVYQVLLVEAFYALFCGQCPPPLSYVSDF